MKIRGIEGLSDQEINTQLQNGARFVIFQYCVSIIVMSFRRSSSIHFIPANSSTLKKGAPFVLLSMLVGWWGIPWGPIWTIGTVFKNLSGGVDVTGDVINALRPAAAIQQAPGVVRHDAAG